MTANPFPKIVANLGDGISAADLKFLMTEALPLITKFIDATTPFKTGKLRAGTRYGLTSGNTAFIRNNERYAMPVHEGSRAHDIVATNAKFLAFNPGGGMVYRKKVRHPGSAANPFITRGTEQAQPALSSLLATWGQLVFSKAVR